MGSTANITNTASTASTGPAGPAGGMESHLSRFPCNTCSRTFATNELQRDHMRSAWHISNLRRRVAGLSALPEAEHDADSRTKTAGPRDDVVSNSRRAAVYSSPQPEEKLDTEQIAIPPTQCLFCNQISLSLDGNMSHMASAHSLFIPSPGQLIDVESFVGYLALLVFVEHECLYCGVEKADAASVQGHMRNKGHCMIQLDFESELLDFWDFSDDDGAEKEEDLEGDTEEGNNKGKGNAIKVSETEIRLPSGAIASSRSASTTERRQLRRSLWRARAKDRREEQPALEQTLKEQSGDPGRPTEKIHDSRSHENRSERRIAVRGEMGLIGLSDNQRRVLQVTEMKMKRKEALTAAAYRHAIEQQPVKTKYYKTENPVYQAG